MLHSCRKRAQNQTQRIEIGTALQTGQHGPLNRNTAIARQWEALAVWFGCLEAIHRSIQPQIHCGVGRFCSLRQEWTHRKLMKADELRFSSVLCCSSPLCASEQSQGDCSTGTSTGAFGRNSPTGATACHTSDVPTISPWWFHSSGVFNALHSYNQLMFFQCRLCYNFESEIKWNIWQKPKTCQRRPMRRLQAMLELFEEHRCSWHIQWRDAHLNLPRWKLTILRGAWSNSGMVAVHDISWHFMTLLAFLQNFHGFMRISCLQGFAQTEKHVCVQRECGHRWPKQQVRCRDLADFASKQSSEVWWNMVKYGEAKNR